MSLMELMFGDKVKAQIGLVQFDASISETHTDECEITDHPVELGSVMTDHIRKLPISLEINGIITDTPITYLASVNSRSPVGGLLPTFGGRAGEGYEALRKIQDTGLRVTVVTSLRTYNDMAITSLSVTRDASTGNVINCIISLREIQTAESSAIAAATPKDIGNKAKEKAGKKSGDAASDKTSEKANQSTLDLALFGG